MTTFSEKHVKEAMTETYVDGMRAVATAFADVPETTTFTASEVVELVGKMAEAVSLEFSFVEPAAS